MPGVFRAGSAQRHARCWQPAAPVTHAEVSAETARHARVSCASSQHLCGFSVADEVTADVVVPEDPTSDDLPTITARIRQSSGSTMASRLRKVWATPRHVHHLVFHHNVQCTVTAASSDRTGIECSAHDYRLE